VRQSPQGSPCQLYGGQDTPKKHKLLQMNKVRSKHRLEATLSPRDNRVSLTSASSTHPYHDYGLEQPRHTPIHALWKEALDGLHQNAPLSESQFVRQPLQRSSIDHIPGNGAQQSQLKKGEPPAG
jgi:hypothetical protein